MDVYKYLWHSWRCDFLGLNHCRLTKCKTTPDQAAARLHYDQLQDYIMSRQWILASQEGFEASLKYQENVRIPLPDELGSNEVLVKIYAASLNYREIQIADPNVSKATMVVVVDYVLTLSYRN
jgi:NADPH:quinone reductase-like Zn-dependent oxidoreductase